MGGLLGRHIDHPGPTEWVEVGERQVAHARVICAPVGTAGRAQRPASAADLAHRPFGAHELDLADRVPGPLGAHARARSAAASSSSVAADRIAGRAGRLSSMREQAVAELAVGGEAERGRSARRTAGSRDGITPTRPPPPSQVAAQPVGPGVGARAGIGLEREDGVDRSTISSWPTTGVARPAARRRRAA